MCQLPLLQTVEDDGTLNGLEARAEMLRERSALSVREGSGRESRR